jgi:hypothetical protein
MNRQEYADLIKNAALSAGKKLVVNYIVQKIPFFGLTFVNPILGFFVGQVLEIAIMKTEIGAFFLFIDMRTSQQGRDFQSAALNNFQVQKTGTPEEKKNAEMALIDSFRALAKFTN